MTTQKAGEQICHSNFQHRSSGIKHCPQRPCPGLGERWLQFMSLHHIDSTITTRNPNLKIELKGCKASSRFRDILLQKIMPVATCVSQSNSERFDQVERDLDGTASADTPVSSTEDSLPGLRPRREYGQRNRKQIITEVDINQWLEKETGIDRLRMMYAVGPDGAFIQEDTQRLNTMFRRTVVLGAFVSVLVASMQAGNKKEKHISKTQAVLKGIASERTEAKTILKEAFKGTLKFTIFAVSVFHLSQAIAAYRNKTSVWEYIISVALGLGVSGVGQGVKQCAKLSLTGALLGTIGGYFASRALANEGLNQEQKHLDRIRQYLQQQELTMQKPQTVLTGEQGAS